MADSTALQIDLLSKRLVTDGAVVVLGRVEEGNFFSGCFNGGRSRWIFARDERGGGDFRRRRLAMTVNQAHRLRVGYGTTRSRWGFSTCGSCLLERNTIRFIT